MRNAAPADGPTPGAGFALMTRTMADPGAVTAVEGTVAVNCVGLIYVVARVFPFHWTGLPFTNPLPVTVSVKALDPAMADAGDKGAVEDRVATGSQTLKTPEALPRRVPTVIVLAPPIAPAPTT